MDPTRPDESTRAILYLLYDGLDPDDILALHPTLTRDDVSRAAGEGLAALECREAPRVETREERIARLRVTSPRAYEPWRPEEDRTLLELAGQDRTVRQLAAELGRPRGAIVRRLEKWSADPAGAKRILEPPEESPSVL